MSLVVKPHHPWKTRALWALAVLLMLAGGYTLFDYGRYLAGYDSDEASRVKKELLQVKKRLEGEIDTLRQEKALLQRARQIERQAYDDLDGTIKNLQSEILELKEELAFYRGIVSPREASTGLQLQKFSLEPGGSDRRLRYRVVLTQVLGNDRLASGRVQLELEGLQESESKSLTLKDVTENSVNELNYRFKYFQKLEGDIRLPDNFSLLRATLRILPRGSARNSIEKTIDWSIEENR
ncbi:DUF6776 family protein [Thiohalophilus sp.]|uniref:DUF6776 family protein n=1 Tax=Thiohalophilus sp. TaxID=3028392 RepID=UPI002ACED758|nr:DUF6776 family protein [Thiohalophilus sp.]MDZ7805174.1 DUF6776 family protein [Thiohalophilus sp.]